MDSLIGDDVDIGMNIKDILGEGVEAILSNPDGFQAAQICNALKAQGMEVISNIGNTLAAVFNQNSVFEQGSSFAMAQPVQEPAPEQRSVQRLDYSTLG